MQALLEKPQHFPGIEDAVHARSMPVDNPQSKLLRGYLHKTSNSLCGIKGYASLIAGLGRDAESNERWARKIIGEVEKMEKLFASVEQLATERDVDGVRCHADQAIHDLLRVAQKRHQHLDVMVEPIPQGRLILPVADLAQVMKDVLDNCAEGSCGEEKQVEVCISGLINDRGRIALVIADNAGGIPLHLGDRVLDPFITAKTDHVGIGLTRVETILDMHRLAWSLESDHGRGTTVTIEVAAPVFSAAALAGKASDGSKA